MRNRLVQLVSLIDRDVARWSGTPFGTMAVACAPMIVWGIATGQRPADAATPALFLMLAPTVVLGSIAIWRVVRYHWSEYNRLRELGAAEERGDQDG